MPSIMRDAWARRTIRVALVASALALATTGMSGTISAAAIHPDKASIHTLEVEIAENELGSGSVACPTRKRVIAGGAAFHRLGEEPTFDLQAKLIADGPTPDARHWHAAAFSFEAAPVFLRIVVACLPKRQIGPYEVRVKNLVPDGTLHTEGSVRCGRGDRIVTAGAIWNPSPSGPQPTGADNLFRSAPNLAATRWRAAGFSFGSPEHRLQIVLLCRPTDKFGPVDVRFRDIPVSGDDGGGTGCPDRKRALAGGADWRLNGKSTTDGSLTSLTVRSNLLGAFAGGDSSAPGVKLRVFANCAPM